MSFIAALGLVARTKKWQGALIKQHGFRAHIIKDCGKTRETLDVCGQPDGKYEISVDEEKYVVVVRSGQIYEISDLETT